MKIYIVEFLFGAMRLPMREVVVAGSEDEALKVVAEYAPGESVFKDTPRPVGEAYESGARVLR